MALLLMVLALLGTVVLASWHDSRPHSHDAIDIEHSVQLGDHHPGDRPQPGDPMHAAAHVVLQGIAIPAEPVMAAAAAPLAVVWTISLSAAIGSIPPTAILRPPRA